MDKMKMRFTDAVAAKLSIAPQSTAKAELIEELSDNLYRRFLDMAGAGMEEEAAFQRAMEDLGDVDELLGYLGVEPVQQDTVVIHSEGGRTRLDTKDGKRVIINTGDGEPVIIHSGDGEGQPRQDEQGDVHYDHSADAPQSDWDALLANVSEICRVAMDQAKDAVKQAKDAMKRRTTVQRDKGQVTVHFSTDPDEPAPPETPETSEAPGGWEFEAELNSDEGRFFAGAGPKKRKDVIYGFGYDKAKGGFFTQWGEWKGGEEGRTDHGPHFTGYGSYMEGQDDGSYSVTALKDLRGLEVYTTSGDVTIHVSEAPDAGVIIDGDVDDLDVTCSADGVLTIREGRTASSSFFSRRGFFSADVELYIPRRYWESITVRTASGDVEIDRDGLDIDRLTVQTASGDLSARLRACSQLYFGSASGDLDLSGDCAVLHAETKSGDITLRGQVEEAVLNSTSGDIELEGPVGQFRGSTLSGDVRLETSRLPQVMELVSKSGDVVAHIPDSGPFSVQCGTVSGDITSDFFEGRVSGTRSFSFSYGRENELEVAPVYRMDTVSGDVSLRRF